jgi:hypothetical protein
MITRAIVIMAAVFLFTGCGGKKQEASAPVTQPQAQPAPTAATPGVQKTVPVVSPDKTSATNNTAASFIKMNYAVEDWILKNGRLPKNFEEFAANPGTGMVIPPPPSGKKYAFDSEQRVILVNR